MLMEILLDDDLYSLISAERYGFDRHVVIVHVNQRDNAGTSERRNHDESRCDSRCVANQFSSELRLISDGVYVRCLRQYKRIKFLERITR